MIDMHIEVNHGYRPFYLATVTEGDQKWTATSNDAVKALKLALKDREREIRHERKAHTSKRVTS